MLKGEQLGAAIDAARIKKGLSKKALADHFKVKPPSVQGWIATGRIDKTKIIQMITFFSDVVPASHWGLAEGTVLIADEAHRSDGTSGDLQLGNLGEAAIGLTATPAEDRRAGNDRRAGHSPSSDDYALIPQYSAHGECGEGALNEHVEVNGGLAFKRDWLRRMGAKPQHLFVIYACGSSMEPYIFEGDVVLFDSSDTEPRDRQVYAIRRPDGSLSIKRMAQQISGNWLIRSDNQDKTRYPDEEVSPTSMHDIPIVGRVIWRGGALG